MRAYIFLPMHNRYHERETVGNCIPLNVARTGHDGLINVKVAKIEHDMLATVTIVNTRHGGLITYLHCQQRLFFSLC